MVYKNLDLKKSGITFNRISKGPYEILVIFIFIFLIIFLYNKMVEFFVPGDFCDRRGHTFDKS